MASIAVKFVNYGILLQFSVVYLLLLGVNVAVEIPVFYIFGDSLADVGNNLFFNSTVAAPHFPNGIDFGNGTTSSGRFTNGRTVFDVLENLLGKKNFTPPYMGPTTVGYELLKGVNFASSTSGILNTTGYKYYSINFDEQISYFAKTRQDIIFNIGIESAQNFIREAIYIVAIGSNDVLMWARSPNLQISTRRDVYINTIISRFRSQLTRMYELDARKIVVASIGAAGCIPNMRDIFPFVHGCVPSVNHLAQAYNERLMIMLEELNAKLEGSQFIYANTYTISEDIFPNYIIYGFKNRDFACCHVLGFHGGLIPCGTNLKPQVCADRNEYVYWDPYHFTEKANIIAANHLLDGGLKYMYPMNIRQLLNAESVLEN